MRIVATGFDFLASEVQPAHDIVKRPAFVSLPRFSLPTWHDCSCLTIMCQANPRVSIDLSHWTGRFDLASLLKPRHQHPATYCPGRSDAPPSENVRWKMNTKINSAQADEHR